MNVCFQLYLHNLQLPHTKAIVLTALLLFEKFHNNPDERSLGEFLPSFLYILHTFIGFPPFSMKIVKKVKFLSIRHNFRQKPSTCVCGNCYVRMPLHTWWRLSQLNRSWFIVLITYSIHNTVIHPVMIH